MKTEVACTACGSAYLVDREMLDDSGSVPCPACGRSMLRVLRGSSKPTRPQTASAPPPPAAPASTWTGGAVAAGAVARAPRPEPRPAPAPAAAAAAADAEVVCPRCGLHFQPRRSQAKVPAGGRKTLLIVEDNPYFIEIARDALGEWFQLRNAHTLEEARTILADGGIDLLVLDLTLGSGEDGRTLLRQFQAKPCPILVFTARDESEMYGEEWNELRGLGADDMVLKGMNAGDTLLRKACELLDVKIDESTIR